MINFLILYPLKVINGINSNYTYTEIFNIFINLDGWN